VGAGAHVPVLAIGARFSGLVDRGPIPSGGSDRRALSANEVVDGTGLIDATVGETFTRAPTAKRRGLLSFRVAGPHAPRRHREQYELLRRRVPDALAANFGA
jgi:hypothetical protein